jgi:hypothetical protein
MNPTLFPDQYHVIRTGTADPPPEHDPVDLRPLSAYEAVTRQMVESLAEDLREIKGRLNGLIFMMVGTIMVEVMTRMIAG